LKVGLAAIIRVIVGDFAHSQSPDFVALGGSFSTRKITDSAE
jgi:hypothetical protein